jgi:hypothetical protein
MGSPSRTCTFAAVAAAESRRDKVAFENFGIATLFGSDFCSVPFLEALRSSDTLGRCIDVFDGAFGIAGAETLTGLFATIALGATSPEVDATPVRGSSPRVGSEDPRDVV